MTYANKPEDVGVNGDAIYSFLRESEERGAENHGLMIIRNGVVAFEDYCYPYSADMPHSMFSVTKSLVSTAVAFAIEEGRLSLDTQIEPYFSEYKHRANKKWKNVTLESLLTMRSGKRFTFLQDMSYGDYAAFFMKAPFRADSSFLYSNNDAYMVSALLQKVTGQTVVDYLTPRLFEPLGIEKPFWETNEQGVCIGGTGVYLKLSDMAKIGLCYLNGGKWDDKQVIPAFWTEEVGKKKTPTSEKGVGYSYFFWLRKGAIVMDGMFGQYCFIFPKYNAVVAMTSCNESEEVVRDLFFKNFPSIFTEKGTLAGAESLQKLLSARGEVVRSGERSGLEKEIEKKDYRIQGFSSRLGKVSGYNVSVIPTSLNATLARRPHKNMDHVRFSFGENECTVTWREDKDEITICAGMDGKPRVTDIVRSSYPYKMWAYAYWDKNVLKAVVKPLNTLVTQRYSFYFWKFAMKMTTESRPELGGFCSENAVAGGAIPNLPVITPILCADIRGFAGLFELPVYFVAR